MPHGQARTAWSKKVVSPETLSQQLVPTMLTADFIWPIRAEFFGIIFAVYLNTSP